MKNFFDNAIIFVDDSGGDEVKRLQCFYQAATDYEPLIYQLSETSNLTHLLILCEALWRRLDTTQLRNMHKNLIEINDFVPWIKIIYENQGSIEKSSIKKIEDINNNGIFYIGNVENDNYRRSLDKTMLLTVFENTREEIIMHFEDVKDLQSKIMLIVWSLNTDK